MIDPKAKCNNIKIKNKAIGTAISNRAFALCKFSNCPPYVTRYPEGNLISVSIIFLTSSTTLCKSRFLTLIPTMILRLVLSLEIFAGPSVYSIEANSLNGICSPFGVETYKFRKSSISVLLVLSRRMTISKRFSPSKTFPTVFPAKPRAIISFKSAIFKP